MDQETHPHYRRRTAVVTATTSPQPHTLPQGNETTYKEESITTADPLLALSKPAGWLLHRFITQIELISTSLLSLSAPFFSLLFFEPQTLPSRVAHGGGTVLRRFGLGLLGAAYAIAVLVAALGFAVLLGGGIVRFWVEEPVFVRQPLHFDYTIERPSAVVSLGGAGRGRAVPAGHTARVWLELVMPESDHNRRIGVFQVTAEVISSNGDVIVSSSQPCMLRFRSLPVRLTRTFMMGIPLLVGMSSESQKIAIEMLRYKEHYYQTTEKIRVILKPRAGTSDLPQIYAAAILMSSQLPWRKNLVYNWKWTFYAWTTLNLYVVFLIVLVCCFKPLVFPRRTTFGADRALEMEKDERYESTGAEKSSEEFYDALRRWQERSRSKRKVPLQDEQLPELIEGSSSSMPCGETSEVIEDLGDFAASECSECLGG